MELAAPANLEIVDQPQRAGVLMHPLRREILATLIEPDSASGLARKLGKPRQKINYHLRELEREGFLRLVEERTRRNCVERIVQATAKSYVINPEVLGALGDSPEEIRSRFSASYLIASAAKLIKDVATLRRRAEAVGKKLPTLTMQSDVRFASAKDRYLFTEELTNTFARLVAKYHDERTPDGRAYRFLLGAHPVITKTEAEARDEELAHRAHQAQHAKKEQPDDQ